ncbi:hypothetical protein EYC84_001872 [Monilinia fructicola]|uniref:Uncharacterized protein n=1 Tax=Monilinia fructicola TaxID=38448 RepID=A0A5M9JQZ3_MONFR|nr:hypothetical protein EYC84_001872 [Monilinia fructicola]
MHHFSFIPFYHIICFVPRVNIDNQAHNISNPTAPMKRFAQQLTSSGYESYQITLDHSKKIYQSRGSLISSPRLVLGTGAGLMANLPFLPRFK